MRTIINIIGRLLCLCLPLALAGNTYAQERYVVTLELSQSHITLDLWEHAKDAMNTAYFDMPVDKPFYDQVKVGQLITDQFRTGSLIMRGSFGSWKVKVKSKRIER